MFGTFMYVCIIYTFIREQSHTIQINILLCTEAHRYTAAHIVEQWRGSISDCGADNYDGGLILTLGGLIVTLGAQLTTPGAACCGVAQIVKQGVWIVK